MWRWEQYPETSGRRREWRPGRAVDVHSTLGALGRGRLDPAYQVAPDGAVWRASLTPEGPGTLRVGVRRRDGVVDARAWGPGGAWLLDTVPSMLGEDDDPSGFVPVHAALREAHRRCAGWRVPRTRLVMEALVPAILEQKVTTREAHRSWRELLGRFGSRAPGPVPAGMRVPPAARDWARLPSWEWHAAGVEERRSRAVVSAARVAGRLEETASMVGPEREEAGRRLRSIPGVGAWTVAEVMQRAHGDGDAVSVGDYHLPAMVGYTLVGHPVDDDQMLALLEPYRGHRYRAQRLIELFGRRPARRAPRAPVRDFRRI